MWQIVATIEVGGKREENYKKTVKREQFVKIDNGLYRNLIRKFQQRF